MPTTARRSLVALAAGLMLATPVLVAGPASATEVLDSTFISTSVQFHENGTVKGHLGNAHAGYLSLSKLDNGPVTLTGFMFDMTCAPGIRLRPRDFGREEQRCTLVRTWEFSSTNAQLTNVNAVQLGTAHIVADVTLTRRFNTSKSQVEHVDLIVSGTQPPAVYTNPGSDPGTTNVTRIQVANGAGSFGRMVLGDKASDNQLSGLRSELFFHTA